MVCALSQLFDSSMSVDNIGSELGIDRFDGQQIRQE